jgi:polyphosphate kinase
VSSPETPHGEAHVRLFDREQSWLEFNDRVLQLAQDERVPLLERAKFLAIFASNLDEFFQIRVAGLLDQVAAGSSSSLDLVGQLGTRVRQQLQHVDAARQAVLMALAGAGLALVAMDDLLDGERQQVRQLFDVHVLPVLTPLTVDASHPFPYISPLSLNLAVEISDPQTGQSRFARVKVPSNLQRVISVGPGRFVLLEDVVATHLDALFPGMVLGDRHRFRVTRDADLEIQEDEADDLLDTVASELLQRRFGKAVRLEIGPDLPDWMRDLLCDELDLGPTDVFEIAGPLDLTALWELWRQDRPDLKDDPWPSATPAEFAQAEQAEGIFELIRSGDRLVHHPYDAFATTVQRFVETAADDPRVLAIKVTLYRTSADSPIVAALVRAANAGKQVLALVELKARFDEHNNIQWAKTLERSGVHVVYGQLGLKTHAKAVLVVRQDTDGLRRYCHVGTGNYNPSTARLYEDVGLFTADPVIGDELGRLFNSLSGFSRPTDITHLLVAPTSLRAGLLARIEAEVERAEEGRITAKMNSLVDPTLIDALYAASQAGVDIDLIVRGICCLRPGVTGLSERIRVRSIVGRYLEHSRIFCFGPLDRPRGVYLSSADLMPRNLDRRVELATPVQDQACVRRLTTILSTCLADDTNAWLLDSTGYWHRTPRASVDAQRRFHQATGSGAHR